MCGRDVENLSLLDCPDDDELTRACEDTAGRAWLAAEVRGLNPTLGPSTYSEIQLPDKRPGFDPLSQQEGQDEQDDLCPRT